MRLICPNCNAQYNVDEALIPEEGRDVQCATCKKTWFQEKSFANSPLKLTMPVSPPKHSPGDRVRSTGPAGPAGPAAPRKTMGASPKPAPKPEEEFEIEAASAPPINDQVDRDELRRAVEEELAVKAATEANAATTDEPDEDTELLKSLREQLAEAGSDFDSGPATSSKRSVIKAAESAGIPADELLADRSRKVNPSDISIEFVEEMNKTRPRNRGIGGGLITALILAGIAAGTYLFRGDITEAYPPAAPILDQYAMTVDKARGGVESLAAMIMELIENREAPIENSDEAAAGNG